MFQPPFVRPDLASSRAADTIAQSFLDKTVRIRVTDGRTFEGRFICVDSGVNVILQGAYQYKSDEGEEKRTTGERQWVGMIMVPGKHVIDVAVKSEVRDMRAFPPPPVRQTNVYPHDPSLYG